MDENKPLLKTKTLAVPMPDIPKTVVHDLNHVGYRIFTGCILMALLLVIMVGGLKIYEMSGVVKTQKIVIQETAQQAKDLKVALFVANRATTKLEEKLANLKNKEDLAKRDLEAYILKRFRTIPKVVAHEMAVQTVKQTKKAGVPFSLIVGLIEVESHFKPWAISKKGARGPMQVMPLWVKKQKEIGVELTSQYDLHNVAKGIEVGIAVFKYHLKEANNDINQGLYLYVGKDRSYANKVFNAMGRFEIFRSTLDTTLRAEENKEISDGPEEIIEEAPPPKKKVSLKRLTKKKVKLSLKRLTFNEEAYARA